MVENENTENENVETAELSNDEIDTSIMSFAELSETMRRSDELLENPNFNPEKFMVDFRTKIDRVYDFIKFAESRVAYFKDEEIRYKKSKIAIENNIKSLKNYFTFEINQLGVKEVLGESRKISLVKKAPTLNIIAEPNERWHLKEPELCEAITTYVWNKENIDKAFYAEELPQGVACLGEPSMHVRFGNNTVPKKAETKKVASTAKKTSKKV